MLAAGIDPARAIPDALAALRTVIIHLKFLVGAFACIRPKAVAFGFVFADVMPDFALLYAGGLGFACFTAVFDADGVLLTNGEIDCQHGYCVGHGSFMFGSFSPSILRLFFTGQVIQPF